MTDTIIGYKVAENNGNRVIVTLQIPPDALTNINRKSVVVKETAYYRANKVFVVKIEDEKGNLCSTAISMEHREKKLLYKVGELLEEPAFDLDLENFFTEGIHFFLTKRVAELYMLEGCNDNGVDNIPRIQNGHYESWYENGQKQQDCTIVNGRIHGLCQGWSYNGVKDEEIFYTNGKQDGFTKFWYSNGHKQFEGRFVNGNPEGLHQKWNEDGSLRCQIAYLNGVKRRETTFVNGKQVKNVCY